MIDGAMVRGWFDSAKKTLTEAQKAMADLHPEKKG
jgi:hypothetical protein